MPTGLSGGLHDICATGGGGLLLVWETQNSNFQKFPLIPVYDVQYYHYRDASSAFCCLVSLARSVREEVHCLSVQIPEVKAAMKQTKAMLSCDRN